MLLPNKLFSYNESIISKFPSILQILKKSPCSVSELYQRVQGNVTGVNEYMEILDCLYALNKIDYDEEAEVSRYVVRNHE
jgi:hypothetical protein